jgi:hypothetical protein
VVTYLYLRNALSVLFSYDSPTVGIPLPDGTKKEL